MESLIKEVESVIENSSITNEKELENFRLELLSRKGKISELFEMFRQVAPEEKKKYGAKINQLKSLAETKFNALKENIGATKESDSGDQTDPSLPLRNLPAGSRHPLQIVLDEMQEIFIRAGFVVENGPEMEDDWHNFSALNFPEDHPARDMQDTFFIDEDFALRTHTSSVQVRSMEKGELPIRIIAPGRVYRNEAVSARANCFFHQVEGLYIDKDVSMADMKQLLLYFAHEFFGKDARIRLRPSYFPFTEPSAEMDVTCFLCNGKGCNVCKYTGWLEVMGCGMVDPAVLDACGIDSTTYSGYAFGIGVERIAMLKYDVKDLRTFFDNDVRFLSQFRSKD
ncbi:MAG: phenylalanine--tRNA ligase subunit alpha [Bacteroidetes bacterium]|nr:phenylalanine--tRNA ligase subunit alpha [Bacteroidota bacterium]